MDLDVRYTRYIYYTYTTVISIINYQRTVLLRSLVLVQSLNLWQIVAIPANPLLHYSNV